MSSNTEPNEYSFYGPQFGNRSETNWYGEKYSKEEIIIFLKHHLSENVSLDYLINLIETKLR